MNERQYLEEHHHITETAIGLAKVALLDHDPMTALGKLEICSEKLAKIRAEYADTITTQMEKRNERN